MFNKSLGYSMLFKIKIKINYRPAKHKIECLGSQLKII